MKDVTGDGGNEKGRNKNGLWVAITPACCSLLHSNFIKMISDFCVVFSTRS